MSTLAEIVSSRDREDSDDLTSRSFIVGPEDAGRRVDAFLAERVEGWSRSRLQQLIDRGDVLVGQEQVRSSYKLRESDVVDVELIEVLETRFEPENIALDIVFEDDHIAVVNKPAGMIVHPGAGVSSGTLANALAFHFGYQASELEMPDGIFDTGELDRLKTKIGLVHRLDKDTSGLIVIAKDEASHEAVAAQFRSRMVVKRYVALVHGSPREDAGEIDRPIARDRWHRTKMTVAANGRPALSLWKVRKRFEKFTLLEVDIKTGRTHQIRVHLASINHPVVGDVTYNEGRDNTIADHKIRKAVDDLHRFFLHAEYLSFAHPATGEKLEFLSEMPEELKGLVERLGT